MNIEVTISNYECPHCGKESSGWAEKLEFEEYNTEQIWDNEEITCECGAVYMINVSCDIEVTLKSAPIDEGTQLPDVVGENQIPLFDTPSV